VTYGDRLPYSSPILSSENKLILRILKSCSTVTDGINVAIMYILVVWELMSSYSCTRRVSMY
jgi:hypothetical protein